LIRQQPYYVAITRYFEDEPQREQLGTDEVEVAWDRYRGGLEYMLAHCGTQLGAEERSGLHLRVQALIAECIAVAIRLRHARKRSAIDSYYLGARLCGMGYERLVPVPMRTLASMAMLEFLLCDSELNRGVRQLLCVGRSAAEDRDYLRRESRVPVEFVGDLDDIEALRDTLLFVRDEAPAALRLDSAHAAQRNVRVLHEHDLAAKFSL
jgi:hypothetical protein